MKAKSGYHKLKLAELLILEPEDWTPDEWEVLCKMCGLQAGQTERIVLHVETMEFFENLETPTVDAGRTYTVTEMCPHCGNEIEMRWNTDTQGLKAFCPVCGKRLMLCDECHQLGGGCDYDSKTDSCRFNPVAPASNEIPPSVRVETPLGALLVRVRNEKEHPGFWIDLRRPDADQDLPLTMVEFCEDEGDLPDGKRCIITRVWNDAMQDEYAYRIVHKGIEEFFKVEDTEGGPNDE